MAISGGLSLQFAVGEESTYGTAVTVDRFDEVVQESVKLDIPRIESAGLRTGRKTVNNWFPGVRKVSGDFEMEVSPNGIFPLLMKHALGTSATTTPGGGTTSRLHTAKVATIDGKSLTVQAGRTGTDGTTRAFTWSGAKIPEFELSQDLDGLLMCKFSIDAQDETTATSLATASYPAGALTPLVSTGATITIGGSSYDVSKFSLKGVNGLAKDRKALGRNTTLAQLEGDQLREYTGTIELESFKDLTAYTLFTAGSEAQIVATFTGAIIEGSLPYKVVVTLPRVRFDGESPTVGGPGLIGQSLPYKALYTSDSKTEVQIETQNINTAP